MKVLWLSLETYKTELCEFIAQLSSRVDLTVRWLTSKEAKHITKAVGGVELKTFDRVLIHLPVRLLLKQTPYLRCVPSLVLLQRDLPSIATTDLPLFDKFLKALGVMPWARVLLPFSQISHRLSQAGIDNYQVPLGIDAREYTDLDQSRSHSAVVLADLENPASKPRKQLLLNIKTQNKLQIFEPELGATLREQLNTLQVTVTCEQGCHLYRALNYQAMASGCLLLTWDRGSEENHVVGFEDMKNVMLFQDERSAQAKLNFLKRHPDQLEAIRQQGKALVAARHTLVAMAEAVAENLSQPLIPFTGDDIEDALRFRFFR
ncbi:MAG: glycosyltransferase [Pseudomonadales bacterium]|nr:glycosyltransferase [Pseudomonadales bacterium]